MIRVGPLKGMLGRKLRTILTGVIDGSGTELERSRRPGIDPRRTPLSSCRADSASLGV